MFYDPIYWVIMALTGGLGLWASLRVKGTFAKWDRVGTRRGLTGAQVAREILARSGVTDVKVEEVGGFLSDHYDPRNKTLRLSPGVYAGTSVAAAGVAAHEVGHALQHARGYKPLQVRTYMAPAAALGSNLSMIILAIGAGVGALGMVKVGIVLFALMAAFTLVTLPVEFDASRRAKAILGTNGFIAPGEESEGVNRVLNAAAWTYVAAFITSLAYFLWHLLPLLSGSRSRE